MVAVAPPEHTKPQVVRHRTRHERPELTKTRRTARRAACVRPERTKTRPGVSRTRFVRRTAALRASGAPRWLVATTTRDLDTHWSRIHFFIE